MNLIKATIASITQISPLVKYFKLEHECKNYEFKPGQWIDLHLPIAGKNIGGYTIASSFHTKNSMALAIRKSDHHPVTVFLHDKSFVGMEVLITHGQGRFYLTEEEMKSSLTFIAGGIGITPLLSMIRSLDKKNACFKIFYSAKNEEEFLFKEELSPWCTFFCTKNYSKSWTGEKKRICLETMKKYRVDMNSIFFICGPPAMIEAQKEELLSFGVKKEKIKYEKWW